MRHVAATARQRGGELFARVFDESGQVLIFMVLVGIVVIVAGGLVLSVDVGAVHASKRKLQQAADIAAFSAARKLPETAASGTCPTADSAGAVVCSSIAQNLAGTNLASTYKANWQSGYNGDTNQVLVTIGASPPTIFAGILGISSEKVSAAAAARHTAAVTPVPLAFFAGDPSCSSDGVTLAKNNGVYGAIQSNGVLSIDGNNDGVVGAASYGGPNNCPGPSKSDVGTLIDDPNLEPYPATFGLPGSQSTICATSGAKNGVNFTINSSSSGIYCATGTITVSGDTNATVTLIAPTITIGGNPGHPVTLSPSYSSGGQSLLMYQSGSTTLNFPANGNSLTGVIYAPTAEVTFAKNNSTLVGLVEAFDIRIDMNNFTTATGTGPTVGGQTEAIAATQ